MIKFVHDLDSRLRTVFKKVKALTEYVNKIFVLNFTEFYRLNIN